MAPDPATPDRGGSAAPDPAAAGFSAAGPTSFDAFRARHGDLDVAWQEGRLRWLRWGCAAVAALILLGFTQSAEIGLGLRFFEVAVGVALLGAFVWLRRASPKGGGVRVDADGLRLLPDGPHLPPEDIAEIAIDEAPRGRRAILIRTRTPHDYAIPLRVQISGHEGRIDLPPAA